MNFKRVIYYIYLFESNWWLFKILMENVSFKSHHLKHYDRANSNCYSAWDLFPMIHTFMLDVCTQEIYSLTHYLSWTQDVQMHGSRWWPPRPNGSSSAARDFPLVGAKWKLGLGGVSSWWCWLHFWDNTSYESLWWWGDQRLWSIQQCSQSFIIYLVPGHSSCWTRLWCNQFICSPPYTCRRSREYLMT